MASLSKERGRKPIIENGNVLARIKTKWVDSDTPGFIRAAGDRFVLVLDDTTIGGPRYELALDEIEMNRIIIEWLTHQQRLRCERDKAGANAKT